MRIIVPMILLLGFFSCKKPSERTCFKGHGNQMTLEYSLDSTRSFVLNKQMKFRLFEDSLNKVIIHGGEHLIELIELTTVDYETEITNLNKCHFLRDADRMVEVEIHYSNFKDVLLQTSDSVIFENTFHSDSLKVKFFESGSSMIIDVDNNYTEIIISRGTADFVITGQSQHSVLKVQDNGYANAENFKSDYMFAASSSTADFKVNLDSTVATVFLDGSGDILYLGNPDTLIQLGAGSGKLIKQ